MTSGGALLKSGDAPAAEATEAAAAARGENSHFATALLNILSSSSSSVEAAEVALKGVRASGKADRRARAEIAGGRLVSMAGAGGLNDRCNLYHNGMIVNLLNVEFTLICIVS
jgi:hypothetical protein